jgi:signal peptidase I
VTAESDAMNPTIAKGQVITADDLASGAYKPHRQDIVLAYPTSEYRPMPQNQLILRRVIGIPGDTVSCDGGGSPLMLNGAALEEPYLHPGDDPSTMAFDVKVPSGSLWLLGDHRNIVIDARYFASDPHQGMIPIANVVGIYRP